MHTTTSYGIRVESEFVERELSPQQVVINTCFIYLFICLLFGSTMDCQPLVVRVLFIPDS